MKTCVEKSMDEILQANSRARVMEPFYLYDISAFIYTKSAERIISPMVAEVYHLIIAIELGEVTNEALADMEETANELVKATEQLASIARRLSEDSDDKVLKQEMKLAAESLLISGKSILLAAQKLLIQPDAGNGTDELVVSAKRILVETLKVLQTEDDIMFRRVIQAAHWLLDCLFSLESTENISAMLVAFRNFSEALLLLTSLTEKLLWELKVSRLQEHLVQTLQMLKRCIPMLHTAKLSNLKYPHDLQVKLSKNYIFDLIENIVKEIISLLKNDAGEKKPRGRNCFFPQHLQKLLQLLSQPQPVCFYEGKFDVHVVAVVFYCMLLADFSRAAIKVKLVKICYHLLKLRKVIATDISTMEGFPVESQLEESTKEKCCSMRAELEHLNQAVQTAVLYQILDNFAETREPLKRLVEAALEPSSQPRKGNFLKELQPLITAFFSHSIQMLKAANFILVTCVKMETTEDIEDCVDGLSKLLATVPLLLSKMSHNPDNEDVSEKLHSLCQVWSSTVQRLLMCFDKVIDLREFLDLSVQEMVGHKECSEKALADQHSGEFSWHASSLCKQAAQVVEFVMRHVDRSRDPIFRNGLLVLIRQLENAILLVKMAKDLCMESSINLQKKNTYSKRAKHLIESACNVRRGLDECNQPDILSPLRENIRNLNISKYLPTCVSPQDSLEQRSQNTIKQNTTDHSEVLDKFSGRSFPVHSFPKSVSQESISFAKGAARKADLHFLVNEFVTATKTQNTAKLNGACSDLLELSNCCVSAAEEALQIAKSPELEKLLHYREIVALTSCLISLAREMAPNSACSSEGLLQMAVSLSERIHEVKQCLITVACSWYSLSKQLFCIVLPCDFLHSTERMDEIMQMLGTIVELAGKATFIDHNEEMAVFPGLHESFLKMQAKFTCVQARTKHLLEKALPGVNPHTNVGILENFDGNCLLWSITVQTFLDIVDQFIGRDVLALSELKTKLKYQVCLQSTMETLSKHSFRLQKAATLSFSLCVDEELVNEMVGLRGQMQVLTEALLQVAGILSVSSLPTPNLSVRFELLQRELAITAKVLLLRLSGIHRVYLNNIQSVIRLAQPVTHDNKCDRHQSNQEAFEKNAGHLMVNVQMVKKIIRDASENPASFKVKDSLFSSVEHLLLLTDEVMGRAGELQSQFDKEHLLVDTLLHEWSAEAGYLVTQLQSTEGISKPTLDLVRRCLQNEGEHTYSSQPFCKTQPSQHTEVDNGKHQNSAVLSHRPAKIGQKASVAWDINQMQPRSHLPSGLQSHHFDQNATASPTASSGESEKWHDGYPISQVIKQMTTQMSYMAQFLKRKGPITTKEQLIACATQIISGGQALLKFAVIIEKNCLDKRCATELQYAIEQTKTISYQLSIISRVNASTGKSRLSAEHLVSNAQNLIQAAFQILKAAEAACVKGLQQLPPNSEEADVAVFCSQWRKRLWWHRVKEASNLDRDELGLRKTGAWSEPTFTSMIH